MKSHLYALGISLLWLAGLAAPAFAQADTEAADRRAAAEASARSDFAAAEAAYSRILARRPQDLDALVARGNARAYQKNYAAARNDFDAVLAQKPDHLGALVGLGHMLAWSGRHEQAMARFDAALAVEPSSGDAQPGRTQALAAIANAGPRYEAHLWLGRTGLPGGQSESGVRQAEFGFWPHETLRLFARYDDGLSRDNLSVARSGADVALKSAGAYVRWQQQFGTLVEFGTRRLPGDGHQTLYRLEQSYYPAGGHEAKFGITYGPRGDAREEWLAHLGGAYALNERWRIEPTYFYSRNGLPGGSDSRLLVATNGRLSEPWEVGGGVALGRTRADGRSSAVREGFVRAAYALTPQLRLSLLARRETVRGGDAISVLALGTSFTWR